MNMLALTILLPLIGFVLLAFSRGRWSENLSATVGMGSVGLAALVTAYVGVDFFANGKQAASVPPTAAACGRGSFSAPARCI